MRILHINTYYDLKGGTEKYIYNLYKQQIKNKDDVRLVGLSVSLQKGWALTNYGLLINKVLSHANFIFDLNEFNAIRRYIKTFCPDVIHFHNISFFSWITLIYFRVLNIAKARTIHDYGIYCPCIWGIRDGQKCIETGFWKCFFCSIYKEKRIGLFDYACFIVRNLILKNKMVYIVPTNLLADIMRGNGFRRIEVVRHSTEIQDNVYVPIPNNRKILFVGRLGKEKGVDILIQAFSVIAKKYNMSILEIVGEGVESENLLKMVKDCKLENRVKFEGFKDDLERYFINSSVVVIPSVWMENVSLVLLEAMNYYRPLLVADIGGLGELVLENETGVKFKPGNYEDLASKIEFIWNNSTLVKKMVFKAKEVLREEHSTCKYLSCLNEIYTKARNNCNTKYSRDTRPLGGEVHL